MKQSALATRSLSAERARRYAVASLGIGSGALLFAPAADASPIDQLAPETIVSDLEQAADAPVPFSPLKALNDFTQSIEGVAPSNLLRTNTAGGDDATESPIGEVYTPYAVQTPTAEQITNALREYPVQSLEARFLRAKDAENDWNTLAQFFFAYEEPTDATRAAVDFDLNVLADRIQSGAIVADVQGSIQDTLASPEFAAWRDNNESILRIDPALRGSDRAAAGVAAVIDTFTVNPARAVADLVEAAGGPIGILLNPVGAVVKVMTAVLGRDVMSALEKDIKKVGKETGTEVLKEFAKEFAKNFAKEIAKALLIPIAVAPLLIPVALVLAPFAALGAALLALPLSIVAELLTLGLFPTLPFIIGAGLLGMTIALALPVLVAVLVPVILIATGSIFTNALSGAASSLLEDSPSIIAEVLSEQLQMLVDVIGTRLTHAAFTGWESSLLKSAFDKLAEIFYDSTPTGIAFGDLVNRFNNILYMIAFIDGRNLLAMIARGAILGALAGAAVLPLALPLPVIALALLGVALGAAAGLTVGVLSSIFITVAALAASVFNFLLIPVAILVAMIAPLIAIPIGVLFGTIYGAALGVIIGTLLGAAVALVPALIGAAIGAIAALATHVRYESGTREDGTKWTNARILNRGGFADFLKFIDDLSGRTDPALLRVAIPKAAAPQIVERPRPNRDRALKNATALLDS
ncbi:hypothetical protein M3G18_04240 [Corynebacterium sp. p3-SID1145]|uniref:hypothetical protein n=1 Tax=unclassified Corynebacterium TaxID=2624378 RepID=UPI0021AAFCFA|nr:MULTISPECIES: hypothetical protein [unclassified Corynebacterium]MCT1452130.1 hypothetical protein [Corynebacterium sp. p3-SID1145]MCT1461832.1 hypothetical protein [Corynebacterium sp. p3-SID1140]